MERGSAGSGRMPDAFRVVGAFDRFNYGDILFAHVSRHIIRDRWPDATITFHGTHRSDQTAEGGVATQSMRRLVDTPETVIWVAGGEVLGARWQGMYEHQLPIWAAHAVRRLRRRIGREPVDRVFRALSGSPSRLPWVFDPDGFPAARRPRIVYNSVGGLNVREMPAPIATWQARALGRAHWLAVRDRGTQAALEALMGQAPVLSPDTAVLMKDLLPATSLADLRKAVLARLGLDADARYILFQCGSNYLDGQEDTIAAQLREVHERTGCVALPFAIGRASGHEDQITARRLASRLDGQPWLRPMPDDLTVWEIMALIAGTECYAGTSLHGFITAFAFARPRVGLSPRVKKLIGFRDDWDSPDMPAGIAFPDMAEAIRLAMSIDRMAMARLAESVVARCRDDIARLWRSL